MAEVATPEALAALIGQLWQLTLALCSAGFAVLVVMLALAVLRLPLVEPRDHAAARRDARRERRARRIAGTSGAVMLGLVGLLAGAAALGERALAHAAPADTLRLDLTAHLWWWELRYDRSAGGFATANELHLPAGRPVRLTLRSADVVHSIRLPGLDAPVTLLPGRPVTLAFRPELPGTFPTRCAEQCGFQHAAMALDVVVEPLARFEAWAARRAAAGAADAPKSPGQRLYEQQGCAGCHPARAPTLAHLAGRPTLGAGALPNTPAHLAAWIRDPQRYKPGVDMPGSTLSDADLATLVAWLGRPA